MNINDIAKEAIKTKGNGWAIRVCDLQEIAKKYKVDSMELYKAMVELEKDKDYCHSCGNEL